MVGSVQVQERGGRMRLHRREAVEKARHKMVLGVYHMNQTLGSEGWECPGLGEKECENEIPSEEGCGVS